MLNRLSQFWQELKRRKVVRVITVYAAAAFVILELVSIIVDPLKLPEWTLPMIIVLLCVGFIIAVILSWIYDVHPEGGIVKTESAQKAKAEDVLKSSNSWKIASYISFVVIVGLIVLNIIPRSGKKDVLDKSIAVLPFRNDSPDQERMYFINGTMEAILNNLSMIEDLRVPGRTSVEQYRDNPKPIPMVAEEMDVSYILEGSGHRDGNNVRLIIQLLDGREDQHLWSKTYDADIEEIFAMQSEIAQSIAREIAAVITPEEKQLIEKIPTTNLTAYDLYQQGKDEHIHYKLENNNRAELERAEELYHDALEYDSTFAQAYTGLANVYWDKYYWETYFSDDFMDSVLILADIALSYDDQLAEAYTVRGDYFRLNGQNEQAIRDYDKAIKFNPNDWMAYQGRGWIYFDEDWVKSLANYHKAASLNHGSELPNLLRIIGNLYNACGFIEKGNNYIEDAFKLNGDSVIYYSSLAYGEWFRGNYARSIEFLEKGYAIDSTDSYTLRSLGGYYLFLGQFEESLKHYAKYIERLEELGSIVLNDMVEIGYVYFKNGYKEEADYYLDEQINYCNESIELGRWYSKNLYAYYDLAAVYAFRGEKDKAFENLRIFNQKQKMSKWVLNIKDDPLFDKLRDEPEFQQIVRDFEAKYQAEYERVRQWLEENDML